MYGAFWNDVFAVENLAIVVGYIFLAFAVVPYMQIQPWTKVWGTLFFFTCGLTHTELAIHAYLEDGLGFADGDIDLHMHLIHLVQAASVWGFVHGLYREFVIPKAKSDD